MVNVSVSVTAVNVRVVSISAVNVSEDSVSAAGLSKVRAVNVSEAS